MSGLEFSEDYKVALEKTSIYLEPAIGLNKQDAVSPTDKTIVRQLNTITALLIDLHSKVNKIEERLQLVEDKLQGPPEDILKLIEGIKATSIKKPGIKIETQQFQVVDEAYQQI